MIIAFLIWIVDAAEVLTEAYVLQSQLLLKKIAINSKIKYFLFCST